MSFKDRRRPSREDKVQRRHNPLAMQLEEDTRIKPSSRAKGATRETKREKSDGLVSQQLSKKILKQARQQREEEEEESVKSLEKNSKAKAFNEDDSDFSDISDEEVEGDEEEYFEIDEDDQQALSMFMLDKPVERRCLADIVMEKIREHEERMANPHKPRDDSVPRTPALDPKVVKVYSGVGRILATYTSGKVPKAFKIVPTLLNWEEVTYITSPHNWSYPTFYVATKTFASSMNSKMAQRFYNIFLLPKIIDDITEHRKLNYHLYRSLKKAIYKPAAFYKGIILPLCEQDVSLLHAHIVGSVLAKCSIPSLQSSAALLKLAQMKYTGVTSVFIRILLNKKYALPFRVIDAMVVHFTNFVNERRKLPVLWHQSLLVFVQRYKEDLTAEQKEGLKVLMRRQFHPQITDEIRRELFNASHRGDSSVSINHELEEMMNDVEND